MLPTWYPSSGSFPNLHSNTVRGQTVSRTQWWIELYLSGLVPGGGYCSRFGLDGRAENAVWNLSNFLSFLSLISNFPIISFFSSASSIAIVNGDWRYLQLRCRCRSLQVPCGFDCWPFYGSGSVILSIKCFAPCSKTQYVHTWRRRRISWIVVLFGRVFFLALQNSKSSVKWGLYFILFYWFKWDAL